MNWQPSTLAILGFCALAACDPYPPTLHPDYTIRVTPTASGGVATAAPCPSWALEQSDPFDNQPFPQYGCSDKRNLAAEVERPDDLIQGRPLGEMRGVTAVGAIRRYDNNQTRGLIQPGAEVNQPATSTAPANGVSTLTGDVTGIAASTSSSSSSSGAAAGP